MSNKLYKKIFFNKFLIILLTFLLFISLFYNFCNLKVYAVLSFPDKINLTLEQFIENGEVKDSIKNRTAGSDGEKNMANILNDYMVGKGYDFYNNSTSYLNEFKIPNGVSNNVIGVINQDAEKYVIIGAHYDSVYIADKSFGFNDNISGVVGVIELSQRFQYYTNFNTIICFYGAEEIGCKGSLNFAKNLPTEIRENILLSINLDSIGQGDYNYYYTTDYPTKYGNSIDDIFSHNDNMHKYANQLYSTKASNGMNYTNLPLLSDNSSFLKQGINSLSFFSGNLNSNNGLGYFETNDHAKIMHNTDSATTNTTVFGDKFANNIANVCTAIINLVESSNFTSVNFEAGQINSWAYSDWVLKGIGVVFTGILFGGFLIFYRVKFGPFKTTIKK